MKTLNLSDIAVLEIIEALDASTKTWRIGMLGDSLPFSDDVKLDIMSQIVRGIKMENWELKIKNIEINKFVRSKLHEIVKGGRCAYIECNDCPLQIQTNLSNICLLLELR